jgi:Ca-activated chloride channel family protein
LKLQGTGGLTAWRNAISGAIDYLKTDGKNDKKVVLLITDGDDNASTETTLDQLLRKVKESDIPVYSVALPNEDDPREARRAKRAFQELAEASGGNNYAPNDLSEINNVIQQTARDIRTQYVLAYSPIDRKDTGNDRRPEVRLTGFGSLKVVHISKVTMKN